MRKMIRKYVKLLQKSKRLRILSGILFTAVVVLIFGAGLFAVLKEQSSKTLSVSVTHEPITLDPAYCSNSDFETINRCCFEGLMKNDKNGNPVLSGASSVNVSDDGLEYTFYISSNSVWSNGEKVKASDYVYAWERAADSSRNEQYAYLFDNIELVEKQIDEETGLPIEDTGDQDGNSDGNSQNDQSITSQTAEKSKESSDSKTDTEDTQERKIKTIEVMNVVAKSDSELYVKLKTPDSSFLNKCAMGVFSPVCQSVVEKETRIWGYSADIFVCNGAYKLSEWENNYIALTKNDGYYDANEHSPETVKFYFTKNNDESISSFKKGTSLLAVCESGNKIKKYEGKKYFHTLDDYGTYYIFFNQHIKPFNDIKVRRALSLAIDRNKLISSLSAVCPNPAYSVLPPSFRDASGNSVLSSCQTDFDVSQKAYRDNVALAKQLLEEAGYSDGKGFPEFKFTFNDNATHEKIAKQLAHFWKSNLGIKCTVEKQNYDKFISNRDHHNFEAARGGFIAPYNDATLLFEKLTGDNNCFYWENAEFDKLVEQMRTAKDNALRNQLYVKAENIVSSAQAVCPIYWYSNCYFASKRLKNFYVLPDGTAYLDKAYID